MLRTMLAKTLRLASAWAALGLLTAGCSAMTASGLSESGGQTGSLTPPNCAEESLNTFVVPEGQTAYVEGWNEFTNPVLKDAAGNAVAISLTQDDETSLVRTDMTLPAGDYTLTYDCIDANMPVKRIISVSEPAPLPTAFGELGVVVPSPRFDCDALESIPLMWTPPFEFLPYLDLVQLTFSINGVEVGPVTLEKPLTADMAGNVEVDIPTCNRFEGPCGIVSGAYTLRAKIVGHSEHWSSPQVNMDGLCKPDDTGCTVGGHSHRSRTGLGVLFVVGCLLLRLIGRRER